MAPQETATAWVDGEWGFLHFVFALPKHAKKLMRMVDIKYFGNPVAQAVFREIMWLIKHRRAVKARSVYDRFKNRYHPRRLEYLEFFEHDLRGKVTLRAARELTRFLREAYERRQKAASAPPQEPNPLWLRGDRMLEPMESAAESLHELTWLWDRWLPRGMVTILVSKPGEGKSGLALEIARRVAGGAEAWPDGALCGTPACLDEGEALGCGHSSETTTAITPGGGCATQATQATAATAIYVDTEAAEAVLRSRVERWGVPAAKVNVFTSHAASGAMADLALNDPAQMDDLYRAAEETHPALVVIDSLSGAHNRDENSARMRAIMMNLARLARDTRAAVLVIHHLRKRSTREPDAATLDRLRGSTTIGQIARCVWAIDRPDPSDPRRRLIQIKNNLAPYPEPIGFTIRETGFDFAAPPEPARRKTAVDRAAEWLAEVLKDGPLPGREIFPQAAECGISRDAVCLASVDMGIIKAKRGMTGPWFWTLPRQQHP